MFIGENLEVIHLQIFGCPVCLHVPKEKRSKLDPSRKMGIFVGYNDQSKAHRIYIPGFHRIEINRNVTFDEDAAFNKYRKSYADEEHEEEQEAPIFAETNRTSVKDVEE